MPRQATPTSSRPRARVQGAHAGLDLEKILDAASRLDPATLTMRSLAAHLGVDHKALNHYVRDRATLMGLIAWRAFSAGYSPTTLSSHDWQAACRAFAVSFVDATVALGPLSDHLKLRGAVLSLFLEQVDALLQIFVDAGFTDETALRLVTLLTSICLAHAQDEVDAAGNARPRREIVQAALDDAEPPALPNLSRILPQNIDTYGTRQFEVSLELFLAGASSLLPTG